MTNNPANIMTIQDLLKGRHTGFDATERNRIKMIRLKSDREKIMIGGDEQSMELRDIYKYHRPRFEEYFKEETDAIFDDAAYVVVFLAEDGTDSRLVGVYENKGKDPNKSKKLNLHYYDLVELPEFAYLKDRVIVDWGMHQQQWHQWWTNEKFVVRIGGYVDNNAPVFDSYESVMLNYCELKAIFDGNDEAWTNSLKSVNCIYAIVDKSNGKMYIGSTYGTSGIYGRWKEYAQTGHGGNVELGKQNPDNFQWIILEVLPMKIKEEKAIARENFYKEKFCTRKFGYNKN